MAGGVDYSKFIGKEVFLCTEDESSWTEFFITKDWSTLIEYMKALNNPSTDVIVAHGILMESMYIPEDRKRKDLFLLATSPDEGMKGCLFEVGKNETIRDVALTIEGMVEEGSVFSAAYADSELTIENVFLLYGKKLSTFICPNDDDVDEEMIETVKELYNEMNKVRGKEND